MIEATSIHCNKAILYHRKLFSTTLTFTFLYIYRMFNSVHDSIYRQKSKHIVFDYILYIGVRITSLLNYFGVMYVESFT